MIAAIICFAIIIFAVTVSFFALMPALRKHPDRKYLENAVIAHRGVHGTTEKGVYIPENSAPAFKRAAELGLPVEIDIRLTKDGNVVVFHDSNLKNACGIEEKPENMTLESLKELCLYGTEEKIQTLGECVSEIAGKVPLLVEFKVCGGNCRRLFEAADEILSEYGGKYWVQSFYPQLLYFYRKKRPEIMRGQLASPFKGESPKKRFSGTLLADFISKPDFISYDFRYGKNIFRRTSAFFGAFQVGWTLKKAEDFEEAEKYFNAYICEGEAAEFICKK